MDSLIRNGLLITSTSRTPASIGLHDGLIAGVYEPGQEPEAKEVINAKGLAILPGVIDMHSHHREGSEPGFEYKDTIYTSTQQCSAGGVTTTVGMPNVTPPPNSLALLKKQFAIYERDAVVDWNFNPAPTIADEIPQMSDQGIAAFKIFMVVDTGRSYPHMPGIGVHDHGKILEIMQHCAKANVPLMVHPHDQALMDVIE
jgi:dihydroorotase-like cyclic amidohydrolase